MKINRHTLSLCPTCYLQIPAHIEIGSSAVVMRKTCPTHGKFESVIESDPLFYHHAVSLRGELIYPGHFVDVTRTCQLRCEPCYMKLERKDPEAMFTIDKIVNECRVNPNSAPFVLTGGEPTLHPQIVEVIKAVKDIGQVEMLTNGIELANADRFNELADELLSEDGKVSFIHLSIHSSETDKWKGVIENARMNKIKIASALIVVRNEEEFITAVELSKELSDCVQSFRIKGATKIWNATEKFDRIHISKMLEWLSKTGKPTIHLAPKFCKPCFYNVVHDGVHLMLVSWYDVETVDLLEISCPPTYRARNGHVYNFVTTALINEGIEKGWINGEKVPAFNSVRSAAFT